MTAIAKNINFSNHFEPKLSNSSIGFEDIISQYQSIRHDHAIAEKRVVNEKDFLHEANNISFALIDSDVLDTMQLYVIIGSIAAAQTYIVTFFFNHSATIPEYQVFQ